jgi:hypothetical protein
VRDFSINGCTAIADCDVGFVTKCMLLVRVSFTLPGSFLMISQRQSFNSVGDPCRWLLEDFGVDALL